jgi:hypothetical protein
MGSDDLIKTIVSSGIQSKAMMANLQGVNYKRLTLAMMLFSI